MKHYSFCEKLLHFVNSTGFDYRHCYHVFILLHLVMFFDHMFVFVLVL